MRLFFLYLKIVLLVEGENSPAEIRRRLVGGGIGALWLPAEIYSVEHVPELGTGKTDYRAAAQLADRVGGRSVPISSQLR